MPSSKSDSTKSASKRKSSSKGVQAKASEASADNNDLQDNAELQDVITIDRRAPGGDRREDDAETLETGVVEQNRRKKQRRRHIDPTTCERDYSDPEIEFMRAMDDYKRRSGRMFPTCSEVLEVIRDLGYVQLDEDERHLLGLDEMEDEPVEALDSDAEHEDEMNEEIAEI